MDAKQYSLLATALCYPGPETRKGIRELAIEIEKMDEKYRDLIFPFISYFETETQENLEEAYTNTFDVQAVCPLEIGYTLFGEDYKRGEFLVRISDLHREHNTDLISSELGDYLPNILRLLSKMPDEAFKKEFIEKLLLPSLVKMLKNFDDKKDANPFSRPLRMLNEYLSSQYTMNPKILEARYE